jgi:hypothetical protein
MLMLENRINGSLISCAYIFNELQIDEEYSSYHVEYHRFNKEPNVISFNLVHKRREGAEELASLVYTEVNKKLKRSKKR